MKKLLLMLAAMGCMMVANAQVKMVYGANEYDAGATIPVSITMDQVMDQQGSVTSVMITVGLKNATENAMTGIIVKSTIESAGFAVKSVCTPAGCLNGNEGKPFDLAGNATDNVFLDYTIDEALLNADKKGLGKIEVIVGADSYKFDLDLSYDVANAGIDGVEQGGVKVWPNPVMSELRVACEGASKVVIMDVAGRVLQQVSCEGASEIGVDMGQYGAGVYMCGTIIDGVLKGVKRVVKY